MPPASLHRHLRSRDAAGKPPACRSLLRRAGPTWAITPPSHAASGSRSRSRPLLFLPSVEVSGRHAPCSTERGGTASSRRRAVDFLHRHAISRMVLDHKSSRNINRSVTVSLSQARDDQIVHVRPGIRDRQLPIVASRFTCRPGETAPAAFHSGFASPRVTDRVGSGWRTGRREERRNPKRSLLGTDHPAYW